MMGLAGRMAAAIAVLALLGAGSVAAQENLDQGKTAAQLYASDCAICHKSPHGLAKRVGRYSLENFLREHYTASRESAIAIAAYLRAVERQPAPKQGHATKRKAKTSEPKLPPRKPTETKAETPKASAPKPAENAKKSKPDRSD